MDRARQMISHTQTKTRPDCLVLCTSSDVSRGSLTNLTTLERPHMTCVQSAPPSIGDIVANAKAKALRGGIAGAGAMVVQVCALMSVPTHGLLPSHPSPFT